MNRTLGSGVVVAVAAICGAGFALESAAATSTTHTLTVSVKVLSSKQIGKSYEVESDALTKRKTKVGFSAESCFFGGQGDKCTTSIALKGGIIYAEYTFPITNGTSPTAKGRITGGSGSYSGAKGIVKIESTGVSGTLTLKYTD